MSQPNTPTQQRMAGSTNQASPSPRPLGEESFYLVDDDFQGGATSMHAHQAATNGWSIDGAPSRAASVAGANDGFSLPAATVMQDEAASVGSEPRVGLSASTASAKADEATSQWGDDGSRSVGSTPTLEGVPRSQPAAQPAEGIQNSPKLMGSGSALSKSALRTPPQSVCTQGNPERHNDELLAYYDNDWVWFAAGAIAVAGTMLLGKHFYRTMQGRPGKAQRSH